MWVWDDAAIAAYGDSLAPQIAAGRLPRYIPCLSTVDRWQLALTLGDRAGQIRTVRHRVPSTASPPSHPSSPALNPIPSPAFNAHSRDALPRFPLMSAIKPWSFWRVAVERGWDAAVGLAGQTPSTLPYNSLDQLLADGGRPRNPLINSGAIAVAAALPGATPAERCDRLAAWLNTHTGSQLTLDPEVLASVKQTPNPRNRAIAEILHQNRVIADPDLALATYNRICCLAGTTEDLVRMGIALLDPPPDMEAIASQGTIEIMATCGLYEASAAFYQRTGWAAKSSISGAVIAIVPGQGAIAVYSPPVDTAGHSVAGMAMLDRWARSLAAG